MNLRLLLLRHERQPQPSVFLHELKRFRPTIETASIELPAQATQHLPDFLVRVTCISRDRINRCLRNLLQHTVIASRKVCFAEDDKVQRLINAAVRPNITHRGRCAALLACIVFRVRLGLEWRLKTKFSLLASLLDRDRAECLRGYLVAPEQLM
jgi:hypothetical protein